MCHRQGRDCAHGRLQRSSVRPAGGVVSRGRRDYLHSHGLHRLQPAANGPILAPYVDALVITPICPHLLTIRPMVVRGDAHVTVSVEGIPDLTFLTVDGQEASAAAGRRQGMLPPSEHSVKLVRMGATGFFDVLRSKLSWGER